MGICQFSLFNRQSYTKRKKVCVYDRGTLAQLKRLLGVLKSNGVLSAFTWCFAFKNCTFVLQVRALLVSRVVSSLCSCVIFYVKIDSINTYSTYL